MNGQEREGYEYRIEEARKNGQKWGEVLERLRFLTDAEKDQRKRLQYIESKLVKVNMKAGLVGLLGGFIPALAALIYLLLRFAS